MFAKMRRHIVIEDRQTESRSASKKKHFFKQDFSAMVPQQNANLNIEPACADEKYKPNRETRLIWPSY